MSEALDRRLVAVMFTDMVGYTALLQADEHVGVGKRDRYWAALDRKHEEFGGAIVQRLGDGSVSMFPNCLAAVHAAVAVQRELAAQDVPVRIGIHLGEVIVEPERLTGDAVNIAARIESFAVPGGVMLSDSAFEQLRNRSDVEAVRLGQFRLKNIGRPFELYAVSADGIVVPDPAALVGKGDRFASLPSNLPVLASPLVGRADDLASLVALVRQHRVVTITGPGGVGKTSVLAELGRELIAEFLDGVSFIALADVTRSEDFLPALAEALDVKEAEGRSLGDGVVLAHRRQEGAAPSRQSRADHRGRSRPGRTGRDLPGAPDRGHQQNATEDRRRAGVPAASARARSVVGSGLDRFAPLLSSHRTVRRAGAGDDRIRAHAGERRGCRGDL